MNKQDVYISFVDNPTTIKEIMMDLINQGKYIVQVIPIKNAILILYNNH